MKRVLCSLLLALAVPIPARADTRHVVPQSRLTDCGPAALATLLRYYLDVPGSESEIARLSDYHRGKGTSLLGMEKAAGDKGCAAGSFLMDFATLRKQMETYPTPVIVRTLNPEPHFSVLLALDRDHAYLADPAVGNIVLTRQAFLKRWYFPGDRQGFVLVVAAPGQHVNRDRLAEAVRRLRQSLENVRNSRPALPGSPR